ncbi:S-adenosyl-L-methionine-dependent methyltransferase [Lophiostoma macrostomum CBS 122681]|uniref:S-adenosyl-L-methionine-dependent methyltransferase n=1 Tax=Lophiostoma macrostomum CBS 122681 TaxID=1314788 RepID=A0A6A6SXM7_9PLEO|nr:S-adenosyl-L-methionine-dependent methyltransferase [Lophiostoma macrostomum CBS 122681]
MQVEGLLEQIRTQAAKSEGTTRQRLVSTLHQIAYSLETPDETLHRYGSMNLQTAMVKTGLDLGLFDDLARSGNSLSVAKLSDITGSEELLLGRILRCLAAIGAIDQVGDADYAANHITRNLTENVAAAGINHYFATVAPQYQALPTFLERTQYKNPRDEKHTVFQDAWSTKLHGFEWFSEHPKNLAYFNDFMASRRPSDLSWISVYPVTEEVKDCDPEQPLYVNIGGGVGHQCAQFKERYPDIPGRIVLQDLSHSIANALPTPGVENIVHNFFEPQPIKGSKFYFMRGVFHNHPDHQVLKLLRNTKEAMAPDSILLIDEMILPGVGAHIDAVTMDITMLAAFAGMERTESQWRSIIGQAGLRLVRTYEYNPVSHESVMDVRLLE